MYIKGSLLNDRSKDKVCFLPIFGHDMPTKQWILGSHVMQNYYLVFD